MCYNGGMSIPKFAADPTYLAESEFFEIRGRASVDACSSKDIWKLIGHIERLEIELDKLDNEDFFGTEGWRHMLRIPD